MMASSGREPASCRDEGAEPVVMDALQKLQLFVDEWCEEQRGNLVLNEVTLLKSLSRKRSEANLCTPTGSASLSSCQHCLQTNGSPSESSRQHSFQKSNSSASIDSEAPAALKRHLGLGTSDRKEQEGSVLTRIASSRKMPSFRTLTSMLVETPHPPSGCFKRWIALSTSFEVLCSCVILANAIVMAYISNYDAEHVDEPPPLLHYYLELVFCSFYTIELALRIYIWRCRYFLCPDWRWNACDTFLVLTSLHEQIGLLLTSGSNNANLSFMRVLRLLKMVKVLRMVRLMRAFREFRMLFNSIAGSLKATVWAFLLIVVMSFMFGLCILQGATDFLRRTHDVSDGVRDALDAYWGSLTKAMLSMYMATTGGIDWSQVADVLMHVGVEYYVVFVLYISLYTCVVTNTITSLFVETTMAFAEKDTASVISDKLERQHEYVKKLSSWFTSIDSKSCGEITFDQFVENANDPDVLAFAETLEIELVDLKQFFAVISCHGKRAVNLDNFVLGCIKLKGMARSLDLMSLMYSHRDATLDHKLKLTNFERNLMIEVDILKGYMERSLQQIEDLSPEAEI